VEGLSPGINDSLACNVPVVLTLLNATQFNMFSGNLIFQLSGAEFDLNASLVAVMVGATVVPASNITVEATQVLVSVNLVAGLNTIVFSAFDSAGQSLNLTVSIMAGGSSLEVTLRRDDGSVYSDVAVVTVTSADDSQIVATSTTSTGLVTFLNVPQRTLLLAATGINNDFGTSSGLGSKSSATITLNGFANASTIDNNNFSLGLAGWEIASGATSIVPHSEEVGPGTETDPEPTDEPPSDESVLQGRRVRSLNARVTRDTTNNDMVVSTSGVDEQRSFRAITTAPNEVGVRMRYRFVTTEIPGNVFGSK